MNPLHTEFARLFVAQPQHALLHDANHSPLLGPAGEVRCGVLELARPAQWDPLAAVWRGVQADLDLPAPAIAINGADAYQLWFAWRHPVQHATAAVFLKSLCQRYLADVPAQRLRCWPSAGAESDTPAPAQIPAPHPRSGQWSAFIAPDLAAVFAEEPWLDRDPGIEAQALLLSRIEAMQPQVFAKAQAALQPAPTAPLPMATPTPPPEPQGTNYPANTPTAFLQAVMQDPFAPLALRVQAAAALLPLNAVHAQRGDEESNPPH